MDLVLEVDFLRFIFKLLFAKYLKETFYVRHVNTCSIGFILIDWMFLVMPWPYIIINVKVILSGYLFVTFSQLITRLILMNFGKEKA